jgi:hypothetical protein
MKQSAFTFFILGLLVFLALNGSSQAPEQTQKRCGTEVPSQQWETEFQKLIAQFKNDPQASISQSGPYTIPVIVHIIHGGQSIGIYPNLAQAQVNSQIQVLNDDFGGIGYNSGSYPSNAFVSWAATEGIPSSHLDGLNRIKIANCNVQFCLATKDTLGNSLPEPGIDRINFVSKGWSNPAGVSGFTAFKNLIDNTIKPGSIWNPNKYFNVWITDVNLSAVSGVLAYATFPDFSTLTGIPTGFTGTANDDGVWCYAKAFGSAAGYPAGPYYPGNDRGRTLTHETGHWLGLRHIWGDGTCAYDFCDDTPYASDKNFGNPAFPYKTTACSGNIPDGEMFMNFMDYVDDKSKYMFTEDQADRIQTSMVNSPYRKFLGTHNLGSVAPVAATSQFGMTTQTCGVGIPVVLSNNASGTPAPNYSWTSNGGAAFYPDDVSRAVTVTFPTAGTYTITLTTNNGTTSSTTKVISVYDYPNLLLSTGGISDTVCMNDPVNVTAIGGNTYFWYPGALTGSVISYVADTDRTYTCQAYGAGNCKTTGVIEVKVTECTGIKNNSFSSPFVTVYPNPANTSITIELDGEVNATGKVQISDLTGKEIVNKTISRQSAVDVHDLPGGIYILKVSTDNNRQQIIKLVKE